MEKLKKNCSLKDHEESDAICYCQECKIYMCSKCEKVHIGLCPNHHTYKLDKDIKDIFTGFCKEERHNDELEYFCKNHNQLCCSGCIAKISRKGKGQHKDCDVCTIEDIKDKKKNNLKENIKLLESLSNTLEQSINQMKIIFEKINENKEDLKIKIQKIFTNIRNAINEREDKLLFEVNEYFNNLYLNENIIKEGEKLPDKIKLSLEKGKRIDDEWNDENKLKLFINDCINIENNIKEINKINEKIKKCNLTKSNIRFTSEDNIINNLLKKIKMFGNVYFTSIFEFYQCPKNINEGREYIVKGEKNNIITKIGYIKYIKNMNKNWIGIKCKNILQNYGEYRWKVKFETKSFEIMVGIAPFDFDISTSTFNNCGWYFYCYNCSLCSGPPHNYDEKETNLKRIEDEIIIVVNMNKKTLKFIIDNENQDVGYTNIPLDKPLTPVVFLYNKNDSVIITEC